MTAAELCSAYRAQALLAQLSGILGAVLLCIVLADHTVMIVVEHMLQAQVHCVACSVMQAMQN